MSAGEKWVTSQKLETVRTEQEGEGGVNWLTDWNKTRDEREEMTSSTSTTRETREC